MPKIDETRPFLAVNIAILTVSDTRTEADENSRWGNIAVARRGAGGLLGLVEEVFEINSAALEAGGLGVGEIVGNHVNGGGKPLQAGGCRM